MSHPLAPKEGVIRGMMRSMPARAALIGSLVILILTVLFPIWKLLPEVEQRPAIPLHYNVHSGIDLFGPWWNIFLIPELGALLLVINLVGALIVWRRERTLSLIFLGGTVVAEGILFLAMVFVVLLNLSYA